MPALRFEDIPSAISIGETYNVAILLESDDGEPMSDLEGVQVQISVEAPHSEFSDAVERYVSAEVNGITGISDPVEISCGEGIIELVFAKTAPCDSLILRASVISGVNGDVTDGEATIEGIPAASAGNAAAADAAQDEELSDIAQVVARLRTAMNQSTSDNVGPKVKHYLMLIKGRMWNAEGNSKRLLDSSLVGLVLQLFETAPINGGASVEAVLEGLNVIEELLINKYGEVMPSCSSCRSLIRPDNKLEVLSADKMGTYHAPCLRCRTCNESVHTQPFVRDNATHSPHHVECAKKANVANDGQVIQCTVVKKSPHLSEKDHVAAESFWNLNQMEMMISILQNKWMKENEYVRERAARVGLHVAKNEVGPKNKRDIFVAAMTGKA